MTFPLEAMTTAALSGLLFACIPGCICYLDTVNGRTQIAAAIKVLSGRNCSYLPLRRSGAGGAALAGALTVSAAAGGFDADAIARLQLRAGLCWKLGPLALANQPVRSARSVAAAVETPRCDFAAFAEDAHARSDQTFDLANQTVATRIPALTARPAPDSILRHPHRIVRLQRLDR